MKNKLSKFKTALAVTAALPRDVPSNEPQTPSSTTSQDNLEEGEITEEDISNTSTTSFHPKIALKMTSGTSRVPPEADLESVQCSRLSSPPITRGSTTTATPATSQYSESDMGSSTQTLLVLYK
jgi:hypothetical protein